MAGYTLQGKTSNGAMVDIPLAATYDSAGNNIISTYAAKADIEPKLASIEEIVKYRLPLGVATWEQIDAIAKLGIAPDVWKVGDEKVIQLTSGEKVTLQIWGFGHDNLTAGGRAPITFGLKNALATSYKMNNSNTNVGGWESSAMRTTLSTTIYGLLPAALKAVIKAVDKKTSAGNTESTINTTSDKLWLPSHEEVFGTHMGQTNYQRSFPGEGHQYTYFAEAPLPAVHNGHALQPLNSGCVGTFYYNGESDYDGKFLTPFDEQIDFEPDDGDGFYIYNYNGIKGQGNDATSACVWWLRSPYRLNSVNFCRVYGDGYSYFSNANISYGVAFGFCV